MRSREDGSKCYSPLTTAPFWIWEGDILKIEGCLKSASLENWIECWKDWIVSDEEEKDFGWTRRRYLYSSFASAVNVVEMPLALADSMRMSH
jgi:hypothetical protein